MSRSVACPECSAQPGDPCRTSKGKALPDHAERRSGDEPLSAGEMPDYDGVERMPSAPGQWQPPTAPNPKTTRPGAHRRIEMEWR